MHNEEFHLCKILEYKIIYSVRKHRSDCLRMEEPGKGGSDGLERETSVVMEMFIILTAMMVPWVYTYVKIYQNYALNMCHLLCANYPSMKLLSKTVLGDSVES